MNACWMVEIVVGRSSTFVCFDNDYMSAEVYSRKIFEEAENKVICHIWNLMDFPASQAKVIGGLPA